jgi:hypothetical protein
VDQAEYYLRLRDDRARKRDVTRDIEFKVNLAVWTALALAGHELLGRLYLNRIDNWLAYICGSMLVLLFHAWLWMIPIQRSEDVDLWWIKHYEAAIEGLFDGKAVKPPKSIPEIKIAWKWVLFEVGFSAVILAFWAAALTRQ